MKDIDEIEGEIDEGVYTEEWDDYVMNFDILYKAIVSDIIDGVPFCSDEESIAAQYARVMICALVIATPRRLSRSQYRKHRNYS